MRQSPSTSSLFADHTIESAPPGARRSMTATQQHLGYLPAAMARMAASPHLLDGFMKLNAIFESSTLDPLAREVLVMTIATRNGCHVCVAMHTARLTALGAGPDIVSGLRTAGPLADERLEAIRIYPPGPRHHRRGGGGGPERISRQRLHQPERTRGRARDRHLHDVHPGQPAHPRPP